MSYARWGRDGSDVYVYASADVLVCECRGGFLCDTTDEMLAHLAEHQAAGHHVPDYTFEGLESDRAENDATGRG